MLYFFRPSEIVQSLGLLHAGLRMMGAPTPGYAAVVGEMKNTIEFLRRELVKIGTCPVSVLNLDGLLASIPDEFNRDLIPALDSAVLQLHTNLSVELDGRRFLMLDGPDGVRFLDEKPFGTEVHEAFPSARLEIREAAQSLSLDRPTAAACHLARALEVVLKVLRKHLRAPDPKRHNWNDIIESIEKSLAEMLSSNPERQPEHAFYARAAETFDHVRSGWRNDTMHAGVFYTDSQAKDLFESTRIFMAHLASRFSEATQESVRT